DGACAVRYRITPTTSEFLAWDVSTGAPYADPEDPFQVSITGLNRIDINGGGASQTLPPLSVDGSGIGIRFLSQDAEGRGYDVTMGILMSDGSYLEASNAPLQVVVGAVTPPAIKVVLL
ncbi:hypothetical protein CMK18_21640, partial [Candidatus Poribacteria bacterium]|nr:hypothetical protein [Candidatus Poribacteria bacterium]